MMASSPQIETARVKRIDPATVTFVARHPPGQVTSLRGRVGP
jgi:hypothetical protein